MTDLLGSTLPRIWTPPQVIGPAGPCGCGCALTPETSLGFAVTEFAALIGHPLDPWQRWLAIHALEMLPDGRPRFRQLLVLVARQNGKTELLVILALFWMWVERVPLILGTSTTLKYAREAWDKAWRLAKRSRDLAPDIPRGSPRKANGEQEFWAFWPAEDAVSDEDGDTSRYLIAASNEEGGRSLTVHRLIEDELRQHRDWSAHSAAEEAMNAVRDGQAWGITNAGDARSVVLNSLRDSALKHLETGDVDDRLGLFEWSAPEGCDIEDPQAWAAANPNLGRRIDALSLAGKARRAKRAGGEQEAAFRTESLCMAVQSMRALPLELVAWDACADQNCRRAGYPVLSLDVAPDRSRSAVSFAAEIADGSPMVQAVRAAPGTSWVVDEVARMALERGASAVVVDSIGAASSLRADLEEALKGVCDLVVMSSAQVADAYGVFHDAVTSGRLRHPGQREMQEAIEGATTRPLGDRLTWDRKHKGADITPLVAATNALWRLLAGQESTGGWAVSL